MKTNLILPLIAVASTVLVGWVHGRMSDRWGIPDSVYDAASKLDEIPMQFGNWKGTEHAEMSERTRVVSGAVGHFSRTYVNPNGDGEAVVVTMLCGRPGPIASHSPAVCFLAAGTQMLEKERPITIRGTKNAEVDFFKATFRPPETASGFDILTFWACTADGKNWKAITDGRLEFANEGHLYRIFVTTPVSSADADDDVAADRLTRFLEEFLVSVDQAING